MLGGRVGPYRIERELGTGGMGTVWLATVEGDVRGLERGAEVAVKVVHPHLLSTPGFFKRFLREAEVGKAVRHENVVRTLDVDATLVEDRQVNYMVLEYVRGRSLRKLLADLGTVPEALVREIAQQVASGLAAIHALGIVHRDLKPENVLITDEHRVQIMDLGVAKLQEVSVALTREGQFAGSLAYAAPEQFTGGDVGPASDLYSLGILLYELCAGSNPFEEATPASVIHGHLHREPPWLAERNPDLSPFFASLVAWLLAKNPADRPGSAAEVAELAREGERSAWWGEQERRVRARSASLPRISVRKESELHGREREIAMLRDAWTAAKGGHGSLVLVEGEAGIGKTRLIEAFVRTLEGEDANVLYGAYPPSGGLGGLSDAVIGRLGERSLEDALRPYLSVTPSLVPSFAALLRHEAPPTGAPALSGDSLHAVFRNFIRALAAEKPTLWILEDLHFAPQESRDALLEMARAIPGDRALLVATTRPHLSETELLHFTKLDAFRRLELPRLSAREVVELLRDVFRSDTLTERLGATIAYKSDGVPFFIFEIVRALRDSGTVTRTPDGSHVQTKVVSDMEVPSAVKDLVESRLLGLSKEERELLDVAAVQGYEFDPGLLAAVLERRKVRVLQDLAEIERRSGLVRGEAGRTRFDQYQIHEVLYRGLMPDLRAEYHSLLAEAYAEREGLRGAEPKTVGGAHAEFLAWHHLRGSTPAAGLPYLRRALDHLDDSYRNDAGIELARLALDRSGLLTGSRRAATLRVLAALFTRLGRREDEGRAAREAVDAARESGDRIEHRRAVRTLAVHLVWSGRASEAMQVLEAQLQEARDDGDVNGECGLLSMLAVARTHAGDHAGARDALERLADNAPWRRIALGNLFLSHQYLGRYAAALDADPRNAGGNAEPEDSASQAIAQINWGRLFGVLGKPDEARAALLKGRDVLRSIGERRPESYAVHRLGEIAERQGEESEAERLYGEALLLRREIRYANGIAETLVAFGRFRVGQERLEEARTLLEEALTVSREISDPDGVVLAACHLARAGGDAAAARAVFDEFSGRLRAATTMEARFALWQAGHDPADLAEANRVLREIVENSPEEHRESMLASVPLHRDIAAAAQAAGI